MKKYKPIIIVSGEPNSIFLEILFKTIKKTRIKSPIVLITSEKLVKSQMYKLDFNFKLQTIDKNFNFKKINNKHINIINVDYDLSDQSRKLTLESNKYILECFKIAFEILKKHKRKKFINGPINKTTFLNKKYLGITEYISSKFKIKNSAMLIYNKSLSVCPITTHLPIKDISKKINKKLIIDKIRVINNFYKKEFNFKPLIGVVGLNPHCESIHNFDEDKRIIKPAIDFLKKKKFYIDGPFSADTIFLSQNRKKFNVIIGMYHDQVISPLKTLFEFDAINITIGLPFLRISPDHGPNLKMIGKNKSNPLSLMRAISFLDKN